jgi:hypothetical protein
MIKLYYVVRCEFFTDRRGWVEQIIYVSQDWHECYDFCRSQPDDSMHKDTHGNVSYVVNDADQIEKMTNLRVREDCREEYIPQEPLYC